MLNTFLSCLPLGSTFTKCRFYSNVQTFLSFEFLIIGTSEEQSADSHVCCILCQLELSPFRYSYYEYHLYSISHNRVILLSYTTLQIKNENVRLMQNINTLYWLLSCLTNSEIQVSLFVTRVFLTKQEKEIVIPKPLLPFSSRVGSR